MNPHVSAVFQDLHILHIPMTSNSRFLQGHVQKRACRPLPKVMYIKIGNNPLYIYIQIYIHCVHYIYIYIYIYITLHYITLHYITLHYMILYYIYTDIDHD